MAAKTDTELQTYLDDLAKHGNVSKAARAAGMRLKTVLQYRKADKDFAEAEELAQQEAADALEEAAFERAVNGIETTLVGKDGEFKGFKTNYSDSLLTLLLKGAKPDKYADRQKSEISNPDGSLQPDSTAAAAHIAAILNLARARRNGEDDLLS
jgi:hypothetical protein